MPGRHDRLFQTPAPAGGMFVLAARVMAVTLCFPALSSSSTENLPTRPPACWFQRFVIAMGLAGTYPNDSNIVHTVFETLWLLAGVFLGHDGDGRMVVETWKYTTLVLGKSESAWAKRKLGIDVQKNLRSEAIPCRNGDFPKARGKDETLSKHLYVQDGTMRPAIESLSPPTWRRPRRQGGV